MRFFYAPLIILLFWLPGTAFAQGIQGRAAQGGVLVKGVEVRAYKAGGGTFGPMNGGKILGKTTAASDGKFQLELPAGRYVVEAIKKKSGNSSQKPEPGDLYCLHSGSPITVAPGKWTAVGLNITKVNPQTEAEGENSLIKGTLTFNGNPVEKAYLYLYTSVNGDFHGPADILQPVAKGSFRVRVPPGKYYLVARKRKKGGSNGPLEPGDLFNFYPQNPVVVGPGKEITIELGLLERLSTLEEIEGGYKGLKVVVTDGMGRPLKGYYVLAYEAQGRTGHPETTAGPTDKDGIVFLTATDKAKYLRVRPVIGGPPEVDEKTGDVTLSGGETELKVKVVGR